MVVKRLFICVLKKCNRDTFRFTKKNVSFYNPRTFRFADYKINRAKTIDCHRDLSIIQNNKKGENFTIRLRLREPLRLLEYSDEKRISYYNKCEILRIISPNIDMNVNEGYESIYVAYEEICKRYDLIKQDNLLDILQDRGELLRNKL